MISPATDPGSRGRGGILADRGQAAIEYLGLIVVSTLIVLGIAAASPELRESVTDMLDRATCTLQGGTDCDDATSDGEAGTESLPGEVDPEAPRPETSETDENADAASLGGAGSFEFADLPDGTGGTTCFASTQDCAGPLEPGQIPEITPESEICSGLEGDESEECRANIEALLGQVPAELRGDLESAIAGAIDMSSCPGIVDEGTQECDAEKRGIIASLVAGELQQYVDDPEEFAEKAEDIRAGDEDFPLQEALKSPADCPDDFLSETILRTAKCKLDRGASVDGLLSGALNWPGAKPFKLLKEGIEAAIKRGGKEAAEEGGEQGVKRGSRSLLPDAVDGRLKATFERLRVPYERDVAALGDDLKRLRASGISERTVAERMYAARQALKAKYLAKTPIAPRLAIYTRNLVKYGSATGPKFGRLLKTKTPSEIAESAARSGGNDLFGGFR